MFVAGGIAATSIGHPGCWLELQARLAQQAWYCRCWRVVFDHFGATVLLCGGGESASGRR
jgi:hypothetical protein